MNKNYFLIICKINNKLSIKIKIIFNEIYLFDKVIKMKINNNIKKWYLFISYNNKK